VALRIRPPDLEPVKLPSGLDHLSASSISTYLVCPMQWYFRYVKGVKSPPAIALEFGKSGHDALKMNNMHKLDQGKDLPSKIVCDKFSDQLAVKKKDIEDWGDENPDKAYDKHQELGRKLLNDYMNEAAELFTPDEEPEVEVRETIAGVPLLMFIDLISGNEIWDYKFVSTKKNDSDVKNSLQMWVYCIAKNKSKANLLSFCKRTKNIESASADITDTDKNWCKSIIRKTAGAISAGVFFPRNPDGQEKWRCSQRFCGYYHLCRGKGRC